MIAVDPISRIIGELAAAGYSACRASELPQATSGVFGGEVQKEGKQEMENGFETVELVGGPFHGQTAVVQDGAYARSFSSGVIVANYELKDGQWQFIEPDEDSLPQLNEKTTALANKAIDQLRGERSEVNFYRAVEMGLLLARMVQLQLQIKDNAPSQTEQRAARARRLLNDKTSPELN